MSQYIVLSRIRCLDVDFMINPLIGLTLSVFYVQWHLGCFFYSGAVSIKMNMLLYAPGVLFCLLVGLGYTQTVVCLSICAGIQVRLINCVISGERFILFLSRSAACGITIPQHISVRICEEIV